MDDAITFLFQPTGFAVWGTRNPWYLVVPIAYILACWGVRAWRTSHEAQPATASGPSATPPDLSPLLIGALLHRESAERKSATGVGAAVMGLALDALRRGILRVDRSHAASPAEDAPGPIADGRRRRRAGRWQTELEQTARDIGGDISLVRTGAGQLDQAESSALELLLGQGADRAGFVQMAQTLDSAETHKKAQHLMRGLLDDLDAAGVARKRPWARLFWRSPVFALVMLWNICMVPAALGMAGAIVLVFATGFAGALLADASPLLTNEGARVLTQLDANRAWGRAVAAQGALPGDAPRGEALERLLAVLVAAGESPTAAAIAQLGVERAARTEDADAALDAGIALLVAPRERLLAPESLDELPPHHRQLLSVRAGYGTQSPAGYLIKIFDHRCESMEDD